MTVEQADILFVDHAGVLGGAELSLADIATHFRARGRVLLLEAGPFEALLRARGVSVSVSESELGTIKKTSRLPGPRAIASALRAAASIARAAHGARLVYCNSPKSFLLAALAGLASGRPLIWHMRDIISPAHFSAVNRGVLRIAARVSGVIVIANSQATADAWVAAGGDRSRVHVVHNGIDPAPFDLLHASAGHEMRALLGVPANAFVVGSFSRLHPWKGHRVLFDALDSLPGIHALVVGGALFSGELEYEQELRARADAPPLAGRTWVLGARHDIPALMAACDVVVHSSVLPEPFGRVVVEAQLAGRPVIAADAGGVREIVEDGVSGLLTPPGDVGALRAAISRVQNDPALRERLRDGGQRSARARFTTASLFGAVDAVLAPLIG